ncbi:hypothetical protein OG763_09865 [Streptomyces sp. NBC_01230]|uniref:hypothetical protein n=1 Tax=Streptomyces sp. NBC_01230 TaxID=2903784 RepID=UPI002E12666F|nr:hypothetical protein OG763_09865 [Streptomyces sp. NBC_01230]
MTKQTDSDEPTESAFGRVKSWYRKNETTIHAIGAVGAAGIVVVGTVLTTLAKQRYTPEGIEPDEREELEEREEKPTRTRCNDGSTSDAGGKQGACSYHGGVAK